MARHVPSRPPSKHKFGKRVSKNAYAVVDHSLFLDGSAKEKKKSEEAEALSTTNFLAWPA